MDVEKRIILDNSTWEPIQDAFSKWLNNRGNLLEPGLAPEPTIKVLSFLALLDTQKECTYDDFRKIFKDKSVIRGNVPNNTLRTSVLNLGKTLEKFNHPLELKSLSRGRFQLIPRVNKWKNNTLSCLKSDPVILILDPPAIKAEDIAFNLIEKGRLPFHALYFLEWSARWWENYSNRETEIRAQYEANAWEKLGIKDRLCKTDEPSQIIGVIGLAPGEGLAEIKLLKKILSDCAKIVHYIAIDSSQRLLRNHINLLKETLTPEIETGRLICAGIVANIFSGLREAIGRVKNEFLIRGISKKENDFLPHDCSILVTYLGNCLGNNFQDQETEIFSIIRSVFINRPLEFLLSVSIRRSMPDEYKRNWDDFLLQTPRHLLETTTLTSSRSLTDDELPEFRLPLKNSHIRCPSVVPEPYLARHQIKGQIYRFYYKLSFDLNLSNSLGVNLPHLPKGTMILLYNIIKYDMTSLVEGIEKCGLFKIKYIDSYHQILDSNNGIREMAVFSAYLEK